MPIPLVPLALICAGGMAGWTVASMSYDTGERLNQARRDLEHARRRLGDAVSRLQLHFQQLDELEKIWKGRAKALGDAYQKLDLKLPARPDNSHSFFARAQLFLNTRNMADSDRLQAFLIEATELQTEASKLVLAATEYERALTEAIRLIDLHGRCKGSVPAQRPFAP